MFGTPRSAPGPQLLARGRPIGVRQVRAADVGLLMNLLTRLSARTCHQRYLAARSFTLETARAEAERIAAARTRSHVALVAVASLFGNEELVGVAELARLAGEEGVGELAVVVRDELHGAGVGSLLVRAVAEAAPQLAIRALHIELLPDNGAMRRLAAHAGEPVVVGRGDGVLQLRVELEARAGARRMLGRQPGAGAPRRAA